MMMDIASFQSIQEQLNSKCEQLIVQKNEYLQNLKSECTFKDNALKTAESLIEQYQRQNQQLKLSVLRLNQKIQNYEQRIQILRQNLQNRDLTNTKTYEKELFKASYKLSNVLQKFSELQEKYHKLEKQLVKYKNYKKQNQDRIQKQNEQKQQQAKQQIQIQFNNFLRTPISKSSGNRQNRSKQKTQKSSSKGKSTNHKKINLKDLQSSEESINKFKVFDQLSNEYIRYENQPKSKVEEALNKQLFARSKSIKQSRDNIVNFNNVRKKQNRHLLTTQNQQILAQKIQIFEWKLKQKDEEIMLMLRRNKQVQSKYQVLKKILEKQKQNDEQFESQSQNINVRQSKKGKKQTYQGKQISQGKQVSEKMQISQKLIFKKPEKHKKINQMLKMSLASNNLDSRNFEPKINHFNASIHSTENSTWKNFQ